MAGINAAALLLVVILCSCASLEPHWQLQQEKAGVQYHTRQGPVESLPEFKASITVKAPLSEVMMLMTDFSRHPDWVYGCESLSVIAAQGFTEAYLYQVTDLPMIKNRDMILHGQTFPDGEGGRIRIQLNAAPDYCLDNPDQDCLAIQQSSHVRVTQAHGEFNLTKRDATTTHITWTQFLDPAGALPHWLYRVALPRVPKRSLQRLKEILEDGH